MKNIKLFLFILFPMALLAQQNRHHHTMEKFTPQQKATLKAKKMRLHLDLTKEQEAQVASVIQHIMENQPVKPKDPQDLTQKERYDMRLAHLEARLQLQEKMQGILKEEQYATWKEMHKGMRPPRGKKGFDNKRRGKEHYRKKRPKGDDQKR